MGFPDRLLQWIFLFIQGRQLLLQKTDTSPDAVLADIGEFSIVIRVDVLQAEGVVEHAAAGDADTAFP